MRRQVDANKTAGMRWYWYVFAILLALLFIWVDMDLQRRTGMSRGERRWNTFKSLFQSTPAAPPANHP